MLHSVAAPQRWFHLNQRLRLFDGAEVLARNRERLSLGWRVDRSGYPPLKPLEIADLVPFAEAGYLSIPAKKCPARLHARGSPVRNLIDRYSAFANQDAGGLWVSDGGAAVRAGLAGRPLARRRC